MGCFVISLRCHISPGIFLNASGQPELTETFRKGESRLDCRLSCAGSWDLELAKVRALHDVGLWSELAIRVLSIGLRNDLTYYYLGRAAEGLGHIPAALTYYKLSTGEARTMEQCSHVYAHLCRGFVFPRESQDRALNLALQTIAELTKRKTSLLDAAKNPAPASANVFARNLEEPKDPPANAPEAQRGRESRPVAPWKSNATVPPVASKKAAASIDRTQPLALSITDVERLLRDGVGHEIIVKAIHDRGVDFEMTQRADRAWSTLG